MVFCFLVLMTSGMNVKCVCMRVYLIWVLLALHAYVTVKHAGVNTMQVYLCVSPVLVGWWQTCAFTHWGRDKIGAISKTTFSSAFSRMKIYEFRLIFPKGPINHIPALVQIMAWRRPGDKSLSEPMMISLPTHICVTRPQWVKELKAYLCHVSVKMFLVVISL